MTKPFGESEAASDDAPLTRLDALWRAARSGDEGPDDAGAGRFLDALLAEGLLAPLAAGPEEPPRSGGDAAEMAPLLIEPLDGAPTLCVFDAVERLAESAYAGSEFIAAPGRAFFAAAAQAGAQLALNPGVAATDPVFSAETVSMIAALSLAAEQEELVGADEAIEILSPAPPSEAMLAALGARLAAAAESFSGLLTGAWLVDVARGGEPGGAAASAPRRLTLTLAAAEGAEADSAAFGALARDLSRLGGVLAPDDGLDVAILQEGERALAAARAVGVGLLAPRDEGPDAPPPDDAPPPSEA
ncbi:MAG: SseB family protein [Pseudomonadota bacterium]